jgi:hypothetical protein
MKIQTISDAKAAITELSGFIDRVESALGAVGSLTVSLASPSKNTAAVTPQRESLPAIHTPAPKEMPERLFQILREAGGPLRPKQMAESYITRGWPTPPSGNVYSTLLNSANYFAKKGRITKSEGGYSLPVQP